MSHAIQEGHTFEPELLKTLGEVFDAEWELIQPAFDGWPQPSIESARTILARVALHLARKGVTDPDALGEKLHRVMRHSYAGVPERRLQ